jgi:hypothetical protein
VIRTYSAVSRISFAVAVGLHLETFVPADAATAARF